MKNVIKHERFGEITYEESIWTGKKSLYLNGQKLDSTSKNIFQTPSGETIELKGNFFSGISAVVGAETIAVMPGCKWYEYVLSLIPILIMVWGNTVALCKIIPIVGGAIGGGISGLFIALTLFIIKKIHNVFLKILFAIAMTGICFFICYLIALAILAA
ncbi:MAG: hypothetical protein J1F69_05535 [Clostridiales bacterium]|nr:hypothetical protein [Clostridiales bacterium]